MQPPRKTIGILVTCKKNHNKSTWRIENNLITKDEDAKEEIPKGEMTPHSLTTVKWTTK